MRGASGDLVKDRAAPRHVTVGGELGGQIGERGLGLLPLLR